MTVHVQLPDRLDYQSVVPLLADIEAVDDDDLVLDAAQVRHMGTLPLQAILSTVKTRAGSGKKTRLANASDSCVDMLSLFGFSPETLTQPETWT